MRKDFERAVQGALPHLLDRARVSVDKKQKVELKKVVDATDRFLADALKLGDKEHLKHRELMDALSKARHLLKDLDDVVGEPGRCRRDSWLPGTSDPPTLTRQL